MSEKTDNFIKKWKWAAIWQGVRYGVPPSITLAQSILESGWGESQLSTAANNYFGIKADSSCKGPIYNANTHEYYEGNLNTFYEQPCRPCRVLLQKIFYNLGYS